MPTNAKAMVLSRADASLPDVIVLDDKKVTDEEVQGAIALALSKSRGIRTADDLRVVLSVSKPNDGRKADKGKENAKDLLKALKKAPRRTVPGFGNQPIQAVEWSFAPRTK
jgi:hypothetical protein